jgi:aminopeptidase N
MNVRIAVAAIILAFTALAAHPAFGQRLPATVVPEHYDLHFAPDFNKNTFAGNETIRVRLTQPSDRITLHAAEIEFHDVTIVSDGKPLAATVSLDSLSETATLTVPMPLNVGTHSIRIRYTGVLNDKLRGFYLSQANNRKYAVTQLEATDARRAFPSFDEPALKATFDVSLTLDRRDTAISNGRIISDTPGPGADKHTLKFSTSPKMSTYLVAMAVGDFECLSGTADGTPIRVCATPDKKHLGRFALEAAEFTVSFYNKYFSIKYPFEKLDIVAVPDFAAGAMENTGAIFYRERLLLVDESKVSVDAKRSVASVLAHEIAHHWFGDLVTMKWWDDIWLNEGFATWMENKPVRDLRPTWGADLVEASDTQRALNLDALQATRPIRVKADTPDQISELFDAITYEKGAAVLRMVENMVGPDVFRTGVNNYLKKYAYGNASAEDFWAEIAAASGTPVARIMGSFVDQSGSPLINIRTECKGERLTVTATQERFSFDATSSRSGTREWQIPVCMKWPRPDGQLQQSCRVFSKPVDTWQGGSCSSWVYANAGGMGAYRTAYQPDMLRRIAEVAEASLLPVERISLLGDEWALVRHGSHTISDYLSLAERLARDRSGQVVSMLTGRLDEISDYFVSEDSRPAYQAWVRQLLQPVSQELGWNPPANEPEDQRERRASIVYTLGWAGTDAATLERARDTTNQYLDRKVMTIDPTLLSTAIQLAATNGDTELYDRMLARMRTDPEPMEQQRFRNALGRFTSPELVRRTIDLVFSEEIRTQDKTTMLGILMANPSARTTTWQAIKDRWSDLEGRLGVFGGLASVVAATAAFCDASSRDDVQRFFETHKVPAAERALRRSLERIDSCIALRNRAVTPLSAFLKSASTR